MQLIKKCILGIIFCVFTLIMVACTYPHSYGEITINSDGTGTREITTYLWKNDIETSGSTAGYGSCYYFLKQHGNELKTYLEKAYEENVPGSETWLLVTVDDSHKDYETVTLAFEFDSFNQYKERLQQLAFDEDYMEDYEAPIITLQNGKIAEYEEDAVVMMSVVWSMRDVIMADDTIFDINCTKDGVSLNTETADAEKFKWTADTVIAANKLDGVGMRLCIDGGNIRELAANNGKFVWPVDTELINNDVAKNNITNALANIQIVAGTEARTILSKDRKPGIAMVNVGELSNVAEFMELCVAQKVIPTFQIVSNTEADKVLMAIDSTGCTDVNVVSVDGTVLKYIREKNSDIRTGLIVDLTKSELTSQEANEIRKKIRSAPATFCIVKSDNASRQAVYELQELAVAVWVEVNVKADSENFTAEVIKAITSGANGIVSSDAVKVEEIINEYFEEDTMTRTPIIIGHRGNPSQGLENSISGFLTAYENGADIFELDVEFTKDGEVIVMHDGTIKRTTNYDGNLGIKDMTLDEIKEYYLIDDKNSVTDEKVPTLKEVFEVFIDKNVRIFIELKDSDETRRAENAAKVAAIVKEYGMEDRVDYISFDGEYLMETQKYLPGMSTGFLVRPSGGSAITKEQALNTLAPLLSQAQQYNSSVNTVSDVTTRHLSQAVAERGTTIWPFTYTFENNNVAFFSGANGITTDDVQWAKDMSKYIEVDVSDVKIKKGMIAEIDVRGITYGNNAEQIAVADLFVKVISGEDCVTVEKGQVTGAKAGAAVVMYGYKTKTTDGSDYVLYTQPITITVIADTVVTVYVVIAVCVVVAVAAVTSVNIIRRKKRK